jgi:hypothetical protein
MNIMDDLVSRGVQEERVVVLPYRARMNERETISIQSISDCMERAYEAAGKSSSRSGGTAADLRGLFSCWSNACAYIDLPKSADIGGVCPFHYNHWSCDGMRGGGRQFKMVTSCQCKVDFTLRNKYQFWSQPNKCHLVHLNHFKYGKKIANILVSHA